MYHGIMYVDVGILPIHPGLVDGLAIQVQVTWDHHPT